MPKGSSLWKGTREGQCMQPYRCVKAHLQRNSNNNNNKKGKNIHFRIDYMVNVRKAEST